MHTTVDSNFLPFNALKKEERNRHRDRKAMLEESNEPSLGKLRWGANSYDCITHCGVSG